MAVSKAYKISEDVITLTAMLLFTGLRIANQYQQKSVGRKTYRTEIFSHGCLVFATILVVVEVALAQRRNVLLWRFAPKNAEQALEFEYLSTTLHLNYWQNYLHLISGWFLKAAYLATFWRLTRVMKPIHLYFLYLVSAVTFSGFLTTGLLNLLICRPIWINWHPVYDAHRHLITCALNASIPAMTVYTVMNVVADLLIAIQGLVIVRTIRLDGRVERGALVLVVAIGLLSIVAPIARFVVFDWLYTNPKNVTADNFHILELLCRVEIVFGTAAYSLALSRSLLRRLAKKLSTATVSLIDNLSGRRRELEHNVGEVASLAMYSFCEPITSGDQSLVPEALSGAESTTYPSVHVS